MMGQRQGSPELKEIINRIELQKLLQGISLGSIVNILISKNVLTEEDYINISEHVINKKLIPVFNYLIHNGKLDLAFNVLKAYHPEEFNNLRCEIDKTASNRALENIFRVGGFPSFPNAIERTDWQNDLKEKLKNLTFKQILVVNGMVGNGKSYLVHQCLCDYDLICNYFGGQLFWIDVADHQHENIKPALLRLYKRAIAQTNYIPEHHCHDTISTDAKIEVLLENLELIFLQHQLKDALVILDNARSVEVINAFRKIRCKLIVTTQLNQIANAQFCKVDKGFSPEEAVTIFLKYLETTESDFRFREKIDEIYSHCKGHPMMLSLLASYLKCHKEHALESEEKWDYVIKVLNSGKFPSSRENDLPNFQKAMDMCIDSIKDLKTRELYYQLCIFEKGVVILPEVLKTFWDMDNVEVREVMLEFENRSLIASYYNKKDTTYCYVKHDLVHDYIKHAKDSKDRRKLHKKMIHKYDLKIGGNLENLSDVYILQNYGYHLQEADLLDRFDVYLNLEFLENKIKALGYNDLLQDLDYYKKEIINTEYASEMRFNAYRSFVCIYGPDLHYYEKTDILQAALLSKDKFVNGDANKIIAKHKAQKQNKLYFKIRLSNENHIVLNKFYVGKRITVVCFTIHHYTLLVGTSNGDILLFHPPNDVPIDKFESHTEEVYFLKISPDTKHFLSVSKDKSVKLWTFSPTTRNSLDGHSGLSSPGLKLTFDDNPFTQAKNKCTTIQFNNDEEYIVSAAFPNDFKDTKQIATGTNRGRVIIWDTKNNRQIRSTPARGSPANTLLYINISNEWYFMFTYNDSILKYNATTLEFASQLLFTEQVKINAIFFLVSSNQIITVCDRSALLRPADVNNEYVELFKSKTSKIRCSTVTEDGKYLALGTDDFSIHLFDVASKSLVQELNDEKRLPISMDTYYNKDQCVHVLVIAFDNESIKLCYIQPRTITNGNDEPRITQTPLISSTFTSAQPLVALVTLDNRIILKNISDTLFETDEVGEEITYVTFSSCGSKLMYALATGSVHEFNIDTGNTQLLFDVGNRVLFMGTHANHKLINSVEMIYGFSAENHVFVYSKTMLHKLQWMAPIMYMYPLFDSAVLFVDKQSCIAYWCAPTCVMLKRNSHKSITTSTFLAKRSEYLVALTTCEDRKHYAEVYKIYSRNISTVPCEVLMNLEVKVHCSSACLSLDGELMAIGGRDGDILVINTKLQIQYSLVKVHTADINFIKFSKSTDPFLVSVGGGIISWWNLRSLISHDSPRSLTGNQHVLSLLNKTTHKKVEHLLQTIKLYSHYATHFAISKDFHTFLVIDKYNDIFILEMVDDFTTRNNCVTNGNVEN